MRGGAGGEIVEVEGGHIVRSTGRKDRHSKVCTAKGPRDRRVRLSAHTAIQFYDVQDRLGYDRPSKAVDWLIKKAKTAIDELAKLPPWNPIATVTTTNNNNNNNPNAHHNEEEEEEETENPIRRRVMMADGGSPSRPIVGNGDGINLDHEGGGSGGSGFFSPSLEVDIADTISSFFPTKTTSSLPIRFQSYTPDLLSRTSNNNNNQDLRLSLQSLQDPILLHQHQAQNHHHHHHHQNQNEHMLFSGTTALGFDGMVAWNAGTDTGGHGSGDGGGGGGGGGGFVFNTPSPSPSPLTAPALLFGQSQYLSQRGPLQSSNNPSIRAWVDAPSITAAAATTVADHHQVLHHYLSPAMMHQSVPGIGFASGGFSGFRVPARIQGEYEEHDGVSDKPSSASSDSRH